MFSNWYKESKSLDFDKINLMYNQELFLYLVYGYIKLSPFIPSYYRKTENELLSTILLYL